MGIISRLGDIAGALIDIPENSIGMVKDLSTAAWGDDDDGLEGFLRAWRRLATSSTRHGGGVSTTAPGVHSDFRKRAMQRLSAEEEAIQGDLRGVYTRRGPAITQAVVGPKGVIGETFEAFPEGVRRPVRGLGHELDKAGSEARESVSALLIAPSLLADEEFRSGLKGNAFQQANEVRRRAMQKAETQSMGQSLVIAGWSAVNRQTPDDDELAELMGSDWFNQLSGMVDFTGSFFVDPLVGVGKVAKAGKLRYAAVPVTAENVADVVENSKRIDKVYEFMAKAEDSALVRERLFHEGTDRLAQPRSVALWEAAQDGREMFNLAFRAAAGDEAAMTSIEKVSARLTDRMRSLQETYRQYDAIGYDMSVAIDAAQEMQPYLARVQRMEAMAGSMRELPRLTKAGAIRTAITSSEFYQRDKWSRPLRVLFDNNPSVAAFDDLPGSDVALWRQLQRANEDLTLDEKRALRSELMAAPRGNRQAILQRADDLIVDRILERAGLDKSQRDSVLQLANAEKAAARQHVTERAYSGTHNRSVIPITDAAGTAHELHAPLWVTQTSDYHIFHNVREVRRAAEEIAAQTKRFGSYVGTADDLLRTFNHVWKPAVLFRVGWPIKVVFDEQLRILSKISPIMHSKNLGRQIKAEVTDRLGMLDTATFERVVARHPELLPGPGATLDEAKQAVLDAIRTTPGVYRAPVTAAAAPGVEFESFVGEIGTAPNEAKKLVSSRGSVERLRDNNDEAKALQHLRTHANWETVVPGSGSYATAWEHSVNNQIGGDRLGRLLLRGELTPEEVPGWLTFDPAGIEYASRLPAARIKYMEDYAEILDAEINALLPTAELRAAALRRNATYDQLFTAHGKKIEAMPNVNGELLNQATGKENVITRFYNNAIEKGYTKLAAGPTDFLSRHPFADAMYRAEIERLAKVFADSNGGVFNPARIETVQRQAREFALGEVRRILYDLGESSRFAETLRFVAPFAEASKEVVTRWTGIAADNPAYVARLRVLWNSPEGAGIVYDEHGNRVNRDGTGVDPFGKKVAVKNMGEERRIVMQLPEWTTGIPVVGEAFKQPIMFDKKALNMITANPFGVGPLVQIPVNQVVLRNPTLADSVKFILPHGPTDSIIDQVLPTTVRRAAISQNEPGRHATVIRIWLDQVTQWRVNGSDGEPPTFAEAQKREEHLWHLKTTAGFFLPVSVNYASPYQHHIDAWRQLMEADPETAEARFIELFGDEYEALITSVTKSNDGVAPTEEAYQARGKYADLIQEYGDVLGRVIIGDIGGSYSQAVYRAQLQNSIGPGSDVTQRQPKAFADVEQDVLTAPLWRRYTATMDLIDQMRSDRGLPNLQVAEASDLAALKRAATDKLAADPAGGEAWLNELLADDPGRKKRKLKGLRALSTDPRFEGRTDLAPLRDYFKYRDVFAALLADRDAGGGAKTLSATSNYDLQVLWETMVNKLKDRNPGFSLLYNRLLERDEPEAA